MADSLSFVGQTVSHYRILEKIGAGGMGEVYRAHDEQLDRDVALKVLPAGTLADEVARKQFRKEALALAKLNHPNIETIHEFSTQDGVDFLVMELIPGAPLSARLKNGALPEKDVARLGVQFSEGLAAAHRQGIIHRDLKPGNLMITPDGRLKILDFGLAKLLHYELASDATQSATIETSTVSGTLPYMSPEQLRGEAADARSDIYAAGAVLYEMATGQRPFPQAQAPQLMGAILHQTPPPPRSLNKDVSPGLESVILKALEKDPSQRYQSARELLVTLEGLSAGAAPVVAPRRARWPIVTASAGILSIVLLVGLVFGLNLGGLRERLLSFGSAHGGSTVGSSGPVHARRSVAVLGFKNLSGRQDEAWLSTALSEMLTTELAAGEQLRTIPGENVVQMKINLSLPDADTYGRETLAKIRKNLNADDIVLGSYIPLGKGQIRLDLRVQDAVHGETLAVVSEKGSEEQIDDLVGRAGVDLRKELGAGAISAAEAAAVKASLPSNPEAMRFYSEGMAKLRLFDSLGAKDSLAKAIAADPSFALAHSALAEAWSNLGYDEKAKQEGKKAFDLFASLSREERLLIEGRYREASKEWDKAIEIYRILFGFFPDNLDYGVRLAEVQTSAGKAEDALATATALRRLALPDGADPRIDQVEAEADVFGNYKQGLSAAMRAVEKGRAEGARLLVARALSTQAWLLYKLGESKRSAAVAEESRRIYAETGDQVGVARQLRVIGIVLSDGAEFAQAINTFDQALAIFQAIGNKKGLASTLNDKGIVLFQQGDFAGAKGLYNQALATYREVGDKNGEGSALGDLGNTLSQLGDLAGARRMYEQALTIHREVGKQSGIALWLTNIGLVLSDQGDLVGAKKAFEESLDVSRKIGDKSFAAYALYGLGAVLTMGADFEKAKGAYSEALRLRNEIGERGNAAAAQVALAELSLEEGHPTEADATLREAREVFQKNGQVEDEINADALLLRTLIAEGKIAEALQEMEGAWGTVKKDHDRGVRLDFSIAAARVLAASGDPATAKSELEATLSEATKYGYVASQFEARLALGEIEMASGQKAAGRTRLRALNRQAKAKGFLLIASKAAAKG